MKLLEYLDSWLSEKIKIKENEERINNYKIINIIETDNGAQLRELPILYRDNEYKVLALTLDENNLDETMKIFPICERTICNSSDAILFVQEKNNSEDLYIFYIELKSEHIEGVLKKHIFMKNLNIEILKLIYLRSRFSNKAEEYQLEFPKNIYEGMIVFQSSPSSQEARGLRINYQKYETQKFKGEFVNRAKKSIVKINVSDGKPKNRKVFLKNFINTPELERNEFEYYKFFEKKI
jgi:hypothetical protein